MSTLARYEAVTSKAQRWFFFHRSTVFFFFFFSSVGPDKSNDCILKYKNHYAELKVLRFIIAESFIKLANIINKWTNRGQFKCTYRQTFKLCCNLLSFLGVLQGQILCVACWCLIIPLLLFSNPSVPFIYCPLPVRHHTYARFQAQLHMSRKTLYCTTVTHQYNHPTAVSVAV